MHGPDYRCMGIIRVITRQAVCILPLASQGIVTEAIPLYLLGRPIAYRQNAPLPWGNLQIRRFVPAFGFR